MDSNLKGQHKCGICLARYKKHELLGRVIPLDPAGKKCPHIYHYLCVASHLVRNPERRVVEGELVSLIGTSSCPQCKLPFSNIVSMTSYPPLAKVEASDQESDNDISMTAMTGEIEDKDEDEDDTGKVDIRPKTYKIIIEAPKSVKPGKNGKLFTCGGCGEVYGSSRDRFRCHEKHIGPYPCPDCDTKPFKRKDYLQGHVKSAHKRSLKISDCKGLNEDKYGYLCKRSESSFKDDE